MRALKITLFIIAFATISTQTFRHIYVKYIESKTSVLDKYKKEIEIKTDKSKNLAELDKMYAEINDKIKKLENEDKNYQDNKDYKKLSSNMSVIRNSIRNAEDIKDRKSELVFYWLFGFTCIVIGLLVYLLFNKWTGIAFVITGLSEMAVWTSPLYRISSYGFAELLNLKLLLSAVSWLILVVLFVINEKIIDKK